MNGDITHVQVEQQVVDGRLVEDLRGHKIQPVKIVHDAYIYLGDYYRISTLFAEQGNVTLHMRDGKAWLDGWPTPPSWFEEAAERLRLEAEELAGIREAAVLREIRGAS